MKFLIVETGEQKELHLYDHGIDIINDVLYTDETAGYDEETDTIHVYEKHYNIYADIIRTTQIAIDLFVKLPDGEKQSVEDWAERNFGEDLHENAKMAYEYITSGGYKE